MGVRIAAPNVDAEAYATEYSAPIRRALEAIHFLNSTPAKSAHNYAPGKVSGSVVGSPVASAASLSVKSLANYIQAAVSETSEMTLFIAARTSDSLGADANRPMFVGTFNGPAAVGGTSSGLSVFATDTTIRCTVGLTDSGGAAAAQSASIVNTYASVWSLYVLRVSATSVSVRDVTHGITSTTTYPVGSVRRPTTNQFRIGSGFTSFQGVADVAACQIHSAALTEEEIQTTIVDIRGYLARKGISV